MTSATDVAAAAAVVNQDTARLLGDKEINQHISAPAPVGPNEYNPLAVSKNSGPLDYFPTLESRDIPKNQPDDGNEIAKLAAANQEKADKAAKAAEKVDSDVKAAIIAEAETQAVPDTSVKPGDSSTANIQPSEGKAPEQA